MDNLVTKKEFHQEIKRLDGSIETLANQVGKNTLEIGTLHGKVDGLRSEMHDKFNDVDNRFNEMHDKFNTVLTAINGLSSQIMDFKTEKSAGEHTFRRHEKQLDDHEIRIEKLERKAS